MQQKQCGRVACSRFTIEHPEPIDIAVRYLDVLIMTSSCRQCVVATARAVSRIMSTTT